MMKELLWIGFICFLQTYGTSSLNCSQYANDYKVLDALPFVTLVNPIFKDIRKTYAVVYDNVTRASIFNIANEKSIPPTVFCLKFLRTFSIRNSSFCKNENNTISDCQISSEIDLLAGPLVELSIYDTPVTHLPTSFGNLKNLTTLRLINTSLVNLPNSFADLQSLNVLQISGSKLTSIPPVIGTTKSLIEIDLDSNAYLRSVQSLNGLPNLSRMSTTYSPITRIPLNLPNMCLLYMPNNKLTNLNGIQTLGSAANCNKSFTFDVNQIRTIPAQIANVNQFAALQIIGNQLTNLPTEIYNIKTLAYLDIRSNQFSTARLKEIVSKFNITNPSLKLLY